MNSDAQMTYLSEVLGIDCSRIHVEPAAPCLVVMVPELNAFERQMVDKILAAAKLTDFVFETRSEFTLQEATTFACDVMSFIPVQGAPGPSMVEIDGHKVLQLFTPAEMLTENEGLNNQRKKDVWALVQSYVRSKS